MLRRPTYRPSRDLATETIRVSLSLDAKDALAKTARRTGRSMSGVAREAIEEAIQRDAPAKNRAPR